jgi:aspartate racemase
LPILHIVAVTGNAIRERGLRKVGLLGTKFVMQEQFYQDRLRKDFGIHVLVPDDNDQAEVHRIIYDELCRGKISSASRRACLKMIDGLIDQGAEGIVLACTELPLLIHSRDVDIPLLDTTRLHAEAAVEMALGV